MASSTDPYATPCPFCTISKTYPPSPTGIPTNPDPTLCDPQCHLILSTPHILAFLDIMPIAPAHILLTTRAHFEKLSDIPSEPSSPAAALGTYLPLLSRTLRTVTGVEDWNVVQNNGVRAAQVVPHVHFHLIPRYQEGAGGKKVPDVGALKSWKMFGKGAREDLDDDEARALAGRLRDAVRGEVEGRKAML